MTNVEQGTRAGIDAALRRLARAAAALLLLAVPARAGIVYDIEALNGSTPTGFIVGSLELPSLSGTAALPLDFSYTLAGFPFSLADVVGATWLIDGTTGAFLNLSLAAQDQNAFPGSSEPIFASLFLDANAATNTFSNSTLTTIFQVDTRAHRLLLVDDGGLFDPPGTEPDLDPVAVPAPGTLALLGLGLVALTGRRRRRGR